MVLISHFSGKCNHFPKVFPKNDGKAETWRCPYEKSRNSAETAVVVAPAQSREEADAILENLGLSIRQGEFG